MGWEALWYIGMMLVSAYVSYSMQPKIQNRAPESFSDIDFPQADEGTPQCVIFGDCWSGDWTVIAVGNYRTTEIRNEAGKK